MIINNEEILTFKKFDSEIAFKIGSYVSEMVINKNMKVCIDIHANNKTVYRFLSDSCIPDNENWLIRKRNTVLYFQNSSLYMQKKLNKDFTLLNTKYGLAIKDHAVIGGGYPLYVENAGFIGSITISGLQPEEDHQFVVDAITKIKIEFNI
jgi:uncharacterized protein (UPF0303 family)